MGAVRFNSVSLIYDHRMHPNLTFHTDGGARGNPGPAACAFVAEANGTVVEKRGWYIGETTNNQAEYQAVHGALSWAIEQGAADVSLYADSELIVKQIRGEYKVKNQELAPWHAKIRTLCSAIGRVEFFIVRREQNVAADALVNETLDAQ